MMHEADPAVVPDLLPVEGCPGAGRPCSDAGVIPAARAAPAPARRLRQPTRRRPDPPGSVRRRGAAGAAGRGRACRRAGLGFHLVAGLSGARRHPRLPSAAHGPPAPGSALRPGARLPRPALRRRRRCRWPSCACVRRGGVCGAWLRPRLRSPRRRHARAVSGAARAVGRLRAAPPGSRSRALCGPVRVPAPPALAAALGGACRLLLLLVLFFVLRQGQVPGLEGDGGRLRLLGRRDGPLAAGPTRPARPDGAGRPPR